MLNALSSPYPDHAEWAAGTATAEGTSWPIAWRPAAVTRLRDWHETGRVEIQWLTTWGHAANGELRLLLGLPECVVAGTYDDKDNAADNGDDAAGTATGNERAGCRHRTLRAYIDRRLVEARRRATAARRAAWTGDHLGR